jgi:nitroreductase
MGRSVSMQDLLEAMGSTRSIRRFRADPIPDALLDTVLWAATRASSPVNSQCSDFVVVRARRQRDLLGRCLHDFAERVDRQLAVNPDDPQARMVTATGTGPVRRRPVPDCVHLDRW